MYSKPKPKRSTMKVHVSHDVILNHILPRVPLKSVCRFKCVSKEWHSFLTSKMFENMHQNNIKLLVFSKSETSSFEFTTIDCEAPPNENALTPTRRPLPHFGDTTPHDVHILTSFHGLVCLGIQNNFLDLKYSDLILWNPLTNEYKRLSKSNSHCISMYSKFGLYYNCCEDDYKLLFVNFYAYIYLLKSDSWRKVDAFTDTDILDHWAGWSRVAYLNENLYFLQHHRNNRQLSSMIRFDTNTERLSKIETPNVLDDVPNAFNYFDTIVVKSDCIHVCVKYDIDISCDYGFGRTTCTCIKLWKLDEFENMKEVSTYQLRPWHVHDIVISSLRPFHLMKNGNWLMMENWWSSYEHKIYEVDLKNDSDDFEYAEIRVDGNNNIVLEQGRYIETFVSPNRYMK